jgi:hypothetical protein
LNPGLGISTCLISSGFLKAVTTAAFIFYILIWKKEEKYIVDYL